MWNNNGIDVEEFDSSGSYTSDDTDTDSRTDDPFNFATDPKIAKNLEEYAEDGACATDSGAI